MMGFKHSVYVHLSVSIPFIKYVQYFIDCITLYVTCTLHLCLNKYKLLEESAVVRIGRTWSEFRLFWAKWSDKGLNWPPKVRAGG